MNMMQIYLSTVRIYDCIISIVSALITTVKLAEFDLQLFMGELEDCIFCYCGIRTKKVRISCDKIIADLKKCNFLGLLKMNCSGKFSVSKFNKYFKLTK